MWVHADSFLRCVASPFHCFVTTICRWAGPPLGLGLAARKALGVSKTGVSGTDQVYMSSSGPLAVLGHLPVWSRIRGEAVPDPHAHLPFCAGHGVEGTRHAWLRAGRLCET